jgi:hypothetical protein
VTADPLSVRCSCCLAAAGEPCTATSSDLPRTHSHRLRALSAAPRLRHCGTCEGSGWAADPRDEGLEALDLACPVCDQPPGEYCVEGGRGRDRQHVVRQRAADLHLTPCGECGGVGWVPGDDAEDDMVRADMTALALCDAADAWEAAHPVDRTAHAAWLRQRADLAANGVLAPFDPRPGEVPDGDARLTLEERDALIDRLPDDMNIWDDDAELGAFTGRDWRWWRDRIGHPLAHPGCCKTCGCATTCTGSAFHDALISTVVRELNRIGALRRPEPVGEVPDGDARAAPREAIPDPPSEPLAPWERELLERRAAVQHLRDRIAQAMRDANGTPEAMAEWQRNPHLVPVNVYADAVMAVVQPVLAEQRQRADDAISEMKKSANREGQLTATLSDIKVALGLPALPLHPDLPDAARRLRERTEQAEDQLRKAGAAYERLDTRAKDLEASLDRWRRRAEIAEAEAARLRNIIEVRNPDDTWTVAVEIPISLPSELRDSLFTAIADAAHDWEPGDRDGWDVQVSGHPTAHELARTEQQAWQRAEAALEEARRLHRHNPAGHDRNGPAYTCSMCATLAQPEETR